MKVMSQMKIRKKVFNNNNNMKKKMHKIYEKKK